MLAISLHGTRTDDRVTYCWPPVVAAIIGVGLTVWNLRLLLGAG